MSFLDDSESDPITFLDNFNVAAFEREWERDELVVDLNIDAVLRALEESLLP